MLVGYGYTKKVPNDTYPFIAISPISHNGRYILVTGSSKGLGLSTALSFAKAGAAGIAVCARSNPANIEEQLVAAAKSAGSTVPEVLNIKVDISCHDDVKAAAALVQQKWGKLDILINNAGYSSDWVPLLEGNPDDWWRTFEVNLKGIYLTCREFIPLLLKSSEKTIVNVSSIGSLSLSPKDSAYQTSKIALNRFTELLLVEYGEQGLLSYVIHPGGVMTDLASQLPKEMHKFLGDTPDLAGSTLVWLTKEKRDWLAGRYVSSNWDMEELVARQQEIIDGDKLKVRLVV